MLFLNFYLFHFFKFQITIVIYLMEKPSSLTMDFKGFLKFYYVTSFFNLQIFNNETTVLLKFFEICADMHFVSLICLNERSITTSLLVIDLKCTVVHYANLNSSSINKSFSSWIYYVVFFQFFVYVTLTRLQSKTVWKSYHFFTNFQN